MLGELSSCSGFHSLFQGMDSLRESQHYQLCLVSGTFFPSISFCQTELLLLSASPLEHFSEPCFCRRSSVLSPQHPSCPFSVLAPCTGDGMGSGLFLMICAVMDGGICSQAETPAILCPLPLLPFPFPACVSQGQPSMVPGPAPLASP